MLKSIQLPPLNVVKIVAVNEQGEVLLLRRSRVLSLVRQIDLPGGIVDRDEAVEAAVRREFREETGLAPSNMKRLKQEFIWVSVAGPMRLIGYVCTARGNVKLSWEHDKCWWVSPEQAVCNKSLSKRYRSLIQAYVDKQSIHSGSDKSA